MDNILYHNHRVVSIYFGKKSIYKVAKSIIG